MNTLLSAQEFVQLSRSFPVIDVRTPAEFAKGHIPDAYNVPLFSNEERAIIGVNYKHQGKEKAMLLGLEFVGPRMRELVDQVKVIAHETRASTFLVHCWRGGMRSASFAWLVKFFGYQAFVLQGGYKAWRNFIPSIFMLPRKLIVLGGPTGSGKTEILRVLGRSGQIIDLEALACHKGSVFGGLESGKQSSQEQFENDLAWAWFFLDAAQLTWIEDESRKIGSMLIPEPMWHSMRQAPTIYISVPWQQRVDALCREYGRFDIEALIGCVMRLHRHLGGQQAQDIIAALRNKELQQACSLLLKYYDKNYEYGLSQRPCHLVKYCALQDMNYIQQASMLERFIAEQHVYCC